MPRDILIEAILFYQARAVTRSELCTRLECTATELEESLHVLTQRLKTGATVVLKTATHVQLTTRPELTPLLDGLRREELRRDIGKAGAETLAIVLYAEPVTRAQIDHIRGVNSGQVLRNLLARGLVEKFQQGNTPHYRITPTLLQHLGVAQLADIPEYKQVRAELIAFTTKDTTST